MDTVPLMLLALHMLALGVVMVIFFVMIVLHRRGLAQQQRISGSDASGLHREQFPPRPTAWLAIRSVNCRAVQAALGVSFPAPCPWTEGIVGDHDFFICPVMNNWIVVTGSSLPQPALNVDRCFHFLIRLSRVLGHVQYFMADPARHHHAWVRVENGAVKRAYAWTGETVWSQGNKSLAEMELDMKCFGYGEGAVMKQHAVANAKKVPLLAARWSIDPMAIDGHLHHCRDGIAGKSSFSCQD